MRLDPIRACCWVALAIVGCALPEYQERVRLADGGAAGDAALVSIRHATTGGSGDQPGSGTGGSDGEHPGATQQAGEGETVVGFAGSDPGGQGGSPETTDRSSGGSPTGAAGAASIGGTPTGSAGRPPGGSSGDAGEPHTGRGGTGAGGPPSSGGAPNSGGNAAGGFPTGGLPNSGGSATAGLETGGATGAGGAQTGGSSAAGGGPSTGGSATGGSTTGGVTSTGGSPAGGSPTGGAPSTGGVGTGGVPDCGADFDECDGDTGTVCETDLRVDPQHCGACSNPCTYPVCRDKACPTPTVYGRDQVPADLTDPDTILTLPTGLLMGYRRPIVAGSQLVGLTTTGTFRVGLYTDAGTSPGDFVASTGELTPSDGRVEGILESPVELNDDAYWIMILVGPEWTIKLMQFNLPSPTTELVKYQLNVSDWPATAGTLSDQTPNTIIPHLYAKVVSP
jgi:hypothetical protein